MQTYCILRVMKMHIWNLSLQSKTEYEIMQGSGGFFVVTTSLAYSRNCLIKGTHFTLLQTWKKEVSLQQRLVYLLITTAAKQTSSKCILLYSWILWIRKSDRAQ